MASPLIRPPHVVPPIALGGMPHMQHFGPGGAPWQGGGVRSGSERCISELAGAWRNADVPGESYEVRGLKVIRTDARGTREFTLHWDARQRRWRWGPHGRLLLVWVADDAIAWVPEQASGAQDVRAWRWERSHHVPVPISSSSSARSSNYRGPCPWRRSSRHTEERTHSPGRRSRRDWSRERSRRRHSRERSHRHRHHSSGRDSRYGNQGFDRQYDRWRREASTQLECGLTQRELSELLFREITPEDYDLLCRLDASKVAPADAASSAKQAASAMENLPKVSEEILIGESCMVCLTPFEAGDDVPSLPCKHHFHLGCISRWLGERPGQPTCPLCCKEVLQTS